MLSIEVLLMLVAMSVGVMLVSLASMVIVALLVGHCLYRLHGLYLLDDGVLYRHCYLVVMGVTVSFWSHVDDLRLDFF